MKILCAKRVLNLKCKFISSLVLSIVNKNNFFDYIWIRGNTHLGKVRFSSNLFVRQIEAKKYNIILFAKYKYFLTEIFFVCRWKVHTTKLGYNKLHGTGRICSLQLGFAITRKSVANRTNPIDQRFSTWCTCTPRGTRGAHRGMHNSKNLTQLKLIWVTFFFWGTQRGYNSDLGVHRGV